MSNRDIDLIMPVGGDKNDKLRKDFWDIIFENNFASINWSFWEDEDLEVFSPNKRNGRWYKKDSDYTKKNIIPNDCGIYDSFKCSDYYKSHLRKVGGLVSYLKNMKYGEIKYKYSFKDNSLIIIWSTKEYYLTKDQTENVLDKLSELYSVAFVLPQQS